MADLVTSAAWNSVKAGHFGDTVSANLYLLASMSSSGMEKPDTALVILMGRKERGRLEAAGNGRHSDRGGIPADV